LQTFQSLGLNDNIVKALTELSITTPTPIQEQAIPVLKDEAVDFLGLAQTGTGKTAAFGLPLLEQIDVSVKAVQAVILSPTRELAQQIRQSLVDFSKYQKGINIEVVYGGAAISNQIKSLKSRKPQILVATPGRMIDLINRKVLNLSNVRFAVLDEADEMLNMGFKEDIDTILSFTQQDKNTWLFSATMPKEIRNIVHKYMDKPVEVSIKSEVKVNKNISHKYAVVRQRDKKLALQRIVDAEGEMYAVIFCRTKAETQRLSSSMAEEGYPFEAIHGDLSQQQRNTVMGKFKAGKVKLLAATDVAARGIDVDNLTHVIHYDLPDDLAFYTHRSGRTARAGKSGIAYSLVTPSDLYKIRNLERSLGIEFEKLRVPSADEVKFKHVQSKLDDMFNTEASDDARMWVQSFSEQLEFMSKEEVVAKYITMSLSNISSTADVDLNAPVSKRKEAERNKGKRGDRRSDRGRDRDRGDRPSSRTNRGSDENMKRFSINIGKDDRLQKGDLLRIICDTTGVRSKHIGRIEMYRDNATFDVDGASADGVEASFKGLRFKGRSLKVSRKRGRS